MTDEQQPSAPRIRDPHAPANLVDDFHPSDVSDYDNAGDLAAALGGRAASGSLSRGATLLDDFADSGTADSGTSGAGREPRKDADAALARRPRTSSRVLCVVLGVMLIAAAFGVWWFGACTETGQAFDDMAEVSFSATASAGFGWLAAGTHLTVVVGSVLLAVAGAVIAAVRRRWWLLGQLTVFGVVCAGAAELKHVLPRPFIIHTDITDGSSAPSGHVVLAVAAALALACAVSRGWRWGASLVAMAWIAFVALSVVYGRWHRPSDAVMAIALVGGVMMISLAFTRSSGMDPTGKRRSSAGVQVLASVAITGGAMACLYASYVIWQITPGLSMSAAWAKSASVNASIVMIVGATLLTCGLVTALRQLTAAPLTRLGLVGAPPAPPSRNGRSAARRRA